MSWFIGPVQAVLMVKSRPIVHAVRRGAPAARGKGLGYALGADRSVLGQQIWNSYLTRDLL